MKTFLVLLVFIGTNLSVLAQVLPATSTRNNFVYYLDHVRLTTLPVLGVDQIDSIKVVGNQLHGEIYIKTKNPKAFHFITLSQIAKHQGLSGKLVIYMLDGEFIQDTTDAKIDSSYILKTILIPSHDFKYLDHNAPFTIMNILTKSKQNLDKEKQVYIRGIETTSIKN